MKIRLEDSSTWLMNRLLFCCMKTSNDIRNYVLSYNITCSFKNQMIKIDGSLLNDYNQTFDDMNVRKNSTFEVTITKVVLQLIPKTTVILKGIEYKVNTLKTYHVLYLLPAYFQFILPGQSWIYVFWEEKTLYSQ